MAAMVEDKKKRTQHTRSVFLMILCVCVCVCVFKTQLWCGFLLFLFFWVLRSFWFLFSSLRRPNMATRHATENPREVQSLPFSFSLFHFFFSGVRFSFVSLSLSLAFPRPGPRNFIFQRYRFSLSLSLSSTKKKKRKIPSDIPNDPQLFFVSLFFLFSDVVVVDLVDDSSENDASLRLESKSWA